ncbi:MAG: hypothetical protein EHM33_04600 [Chloroflexi bacterium]|nr:MAG: hypothetical protein EHM33_04600 [Chloroflexota bacterium]
MSRLSKFLAITVVVGFLLACNFVTQPVRDVENLAETAQSIGSAIPIETLQALPSAIPAETLQALPSLAPTLEAFVTNMPDFGNILNPQGAPVQEWKAIPIMPQATVGQEFSENNTYSFKANVTPKEVQDFYNEKLTALGWNQPFDVPIEGDAGIMVFQKGSSVLTVTITSSEGSSVVVLTLA